VKSPDTIAPDVWEREKKMVAPHAVSLKRSVAFHKEIKRLKIDY